MVEHLTREQIAALLDEPDAMAGGHAHLEVCSACAGEFEAMSRTRMALSGLSDLEAPRGAWNEIRAALRDHDVNVGSGTGPDESTRKIAADSVAPRPVLQARWGPLLTAAAVLALFLGGLGVGRVLAPGGPAGEAADATSGSEQIALDEQAAAGLSTLAADDPDYRRNVAGLWQLREEGPSPDQIAEDPALAAERLTHLDALIEASREALRTAPADPALNDFLFDVVDERASVAGRLDQTIRQASMEY